ncbi:MAG: efflux transporter outer membrane subunit [Pseudomonadota bacterium]
MVTIQSKRLGKREKPMRRYYPQALAITAALILAGCASVGPDYQQPKMELPAAWAAAPQDGKAAKGQRWWTVYDDAALDRLMDEAFKQNTDLMLAMARVDEARALVGLARADQFPDAGIRAGRSRTRSSQLTSMPLPSNVDPLSSSNRITLDVAYELDLWGKYRRATEAARADLLASEAARDGVRLALSADVARTYFTLSALDAQTVITKRTIEIRRESLDLQRKRFTAGVSSELDLRQTEAELAAAEALLPSLERQRAQQQNALAVLLGRSPKAIVEGNVDRTPMNVEARYAPVVPEGLPSDLLLRRPDLREGEERLIAANARIGVARAAYFPTISLTGFFGSESTSLADLFSGPARTWQFAAGLTQPLFAAGRIRAQADAATAREQEALAQYQKAVQSAFRDVQDALVSQSTARNQLDAEQRRTEALTQSLKLARLRYDNGIANLLEVLDTERNLLSAELNRAEALRVQRVAVADLVKALGGAWE